MASYDPYPEKLPSITMLNHQGNNHNHSHQDITFSDFASNSDLYANNNPNTTTNDMSLDLYNQQHLSPPLTPAVSPSNMMDPTQFKRKYSVDVGPFGFNAHSSLVHDQDDYRRSSCSAMSIDDSTQQQPPLHQQRPHPLQQQMSHQYHEQQQQQQPNYYYHNQTDHQSTHHNNSSYLIGNSSSLSGNIANELSTTHDSVNINNNTTTKFSKRARLGQYYQQGPNAAHKHVCKYSECGWSFKRYEHLKRHMLVHTGERPHVCTFPGCGKSFSRSDNFHAHYRTHTKKQQSGNQSSGRCSKIDGGSPLTADIYMPMTASPSSSTSSQQDLVHGYSSSQPFYFNNNKSFEMAYQDVYDQPSFTDEVQDRYSSMNSPHPYMRMGMSSHNGVYSLLNHDESPSMFTSNVMTPIYDMQSAYTGFHSSTGSNASPTLSSPSSSPSTLSGPGSTKKQRKYRTSLSDNLSKSVADPASIMQQKSHVCPMAQCQRRFKRLEHLKRHMRIHTLERPFACTFPQCHKHFSRSDNLSQHMKTHQNRPGQDKRRKSSITNTIGTSSNSSSSSVSPRSVMDDFASTNPPHYSHSTTGAATSTLPSLPLSESVGC